MTAPALDFTDDFRDLRAAGRTLGVAVSGGGDSMALLCALLGLHDGPRLRVVTIDHGLRAEAAAEAAQVGAFCAARGVGHDILCWEAAPRGNLQDAARRARYRLISAWADGHGIDTVALGHTRDDNAETFVMGLMRGAGLDGLSGMRPSFRRGGVRFVRPLLGAARTDLREYLVAESVAWSDDPSNDDAGYDRVRVRRILTDLPVDADAIAKVIDNLCRTRAGLDATLAGWAARHVRHDAGDVLFSTDAFASLVPDMRRRLLNAALRWVASAPYPPRADKVMALIDGPVRRAATLHGCRIVTGAEWRIGRETAAVAGSVVPWNGSTLWDGRWRIDGPAAPGAEVRALGGGLSRCPEWRATGTPRQTLMATPAIWKGETLLAAPLAMENSGWSARIVADLPSSLLSH